MTQLSRRRFIAHGSIGVAIAGALAAVPGLGSVIRMPAAPGVSPVIDPSTVTQPLVAHVRDLRSGEISVFVGTDHIVHRDPELAARLYNAARGDGLVPSER